LLEVSKAPVGYMGQRDLAGETTPILDERDDGSTHTTSSTKLNDMGMWGYAAQPLKETNLWLLDLRVSFGWKLLGILFVSQHISKGFVRDFTSAAGTYIMQEYQVPAAHMGVYGGVIGLPWALKPVIGVMSDCFPIFGYAKAPYILAATVLGTVSLWMLGTFRSRLTIEKVVLLGFCVSLYVSTVDLLTEASYAKALRDKPAKGPSLISYVWGGMTLAGIFATLSSGYVLSHGSPWALYTLGAVPASFIALPAMLNWLQEKKLTAEEVSEQRGKVLAQKEALFLCFIMLGATLILSWSGMFLDTMPNGVVSLCVTIIVLGSFSVLLNPVIAKVNAFGLIQMSLALSFGGASFYFAMDNEKAYPDGPHFSKQFYSMILPLVGSFFTIIGISVYNRMAGGYTYRRMYIVGNLLYCFCSLFDIVFYLRVNKRFGINDHVFVLGSSAFQTVLGTWLWMPSTVIMSLLCPRGMEAIMFALLAGCHNLGATISNNLGAVLIEWLEITPNGADDETEKFKNLWIASLVACVLPTCSIVLVPSFIPDKMQTEKILDDEDMPANHGSLWRWWFYGEDAGQPPRQRAD
jgi:folate/biopterin transporter